MRPGTASSWRWLVGLLAGAGELDRQGGAAGVDRQIGRERSHGGGGELNREGAALAGSESIAAGVGGVEQLGERSRARDGGADPDGGSAVVGDSHVHGGGGAVGDGPEGERVGRGGHGSRSAARERYCRVGAAVSGEGEGCS